MGARTPYIQFVILGANGTENCSCCLQHVHNETQGLILASLGQRNSPVSPFQWRYGEPSALSVHWPIPPHLRSGAGVPYGIFMTSPGQHGSGAGLRRLGLQPQLFKLGLYNATMWGRGLLFPLSKAEGILRQINYDGEKPYPAGAQNQANPLSSRSYLMT